MKEIEELRALVDEIERSPLMQKPGLAEAALRRVRDALAKIDARLTAMEGGSHAG